MTRPPRSSLAFAGAYSCGACVRWAGDCSARGIERDRLPCPISSRHGAGYFAPASMPEAVAALKLDDLTAGDLALIMWRARRALTDRLTHAARSFRLGQRVQAQDLHDKIHEGAVIRIGLKSVSIALDDGTVVRIPADLAVAVREGDHA